MHRFKMSLAAAVGIAVLAAVLGMVGPRRVMAALGFTPVREVNAPGRQPLQYAAYFPAGRFEDITVPAGKRLVVTTIAVRASDPGITNVQVQAGLNQSGVRAITDITVPLNSSVGGTVYGALTGPVLLTCDSPDLDILVQGQSGSYARVTVSGYLIDVP